MSIIYPSAGGLDVVATLRALAQDLQAMAHVPPGEELCSAPILNDWTITQRNVLVLKGSVIGHPVLGDRPLVATSELFALDARGTWARTFSRYYRLNNRKDD
ncbi:DUF6634 family protein [Devosia sp.]|uniref:DUF6634 family protein n=1 Tax=Devosia sp. TaxID=1871048 RepID=UPI001AC39B02|nr:DUF6634 family protein [Devosia sp.]MBN9335195.1 hypothetical protein [Devosia sp.]